MPNAVLMPPRETPGMIILSLSMVLCCWCSHTLRGSSLATYGPWVRVGEESRSHEGLAAEGLPQSPGGAHAHMHNKRTPHGHTARVVDGGVLPIRAKGHDAREA